MQEPSNNMSSSFDTQDSFALQGKAYGEMMRVLSEVSPSKRLGLLKAIAGAFGHRVLPGSGTGGPPAPGVPTIGRPIRAPRQVGSRKTKDQIEIESKIKLLNKKISDESATVGLKLKEDHPLIQERYQLFRALQEYKTGHRPTQSTPGGSDPSGPPSGSGSLKEGAGTQ